MTKHHRPRFIARAAVTALLLGSAPFAAMAQSDNRGAYLAANCANCHGTAGQSKGAMPPLAGMPKDRFVTTMRDLRDGKRAATIMHQLSKGYSDEQIDLMGEYFARQPAK